MTLLFSRDLHTSGLFLPGNESEGLKMSKLSHLSVLLDKERKRAEGLKETCKENIVLLQRQTQLYLSVSKGSGLTSFSVQVPDVILYISHPFSPG